MSQLHHAKKSFFKRTIEYVFFTSFFGKSIFWIISIFSKIVNFLEYHSFLINLINNKVVLKGPFKGLKYYKKTSACGALEPRLLGVYEAELHGTIYEFSNNKYQGIINVGAAEGYYAIGLSMLFPNLPVRAYETDSEVAKYTSLMIMHNNREKHIELIEKDSFENLRKVKPNECFLIIVDCEGCEFKLFNKEIIENSKSSDLIIEMHCDNFDRTELESSFAASHHVSRIYSKDRDLANKEYSDLNLSVENFHKIISLENRTPHHYFLVLKSKKVRNK